MEVEAEQGRRQLAPARGTQRTERARKRSPPKHRGRMVHMSMVLVAKIEAKIQQEEAREQAMDLLS